MKTYNNITIENAENMEYSELLDAVKNELSKEGFVGETATIIADLMVRYDEDVIEENGQYFTLSCK